MMLIVVPASSQEGFAKIIYKGVDGYFVSKSEMKEIAVVILQGDSCCFVSKSYDSIIIAKSVIIKALKEQVQDQNLLIKALKVSFEEAGVIIEDCQEKNNTYKGIIEKKDKWIKILGVTSIIELILLIIF